MRKIFACLLLVTLISPRLWSAAGPDQKQIAKIKKRVAACLEHHRRVTIETFDGQLLQGSISEAGADAFQLTHSSSSTRLNYAEVKNIRWPSPATKQIWLGVEVAATLGVIFGLLVLFGGLKG
ncbi:MAG: hypothetical protein WB780_24390 [Candidatus Acidiferrales bacterium]